MCSHNPRAVIPCMRSGPYEARPIVYDPYVVMICMWSWRECCDPYGVAVIVLVVAGTKLKTVRRYVRYMVIAHMGVVARAWL